MSGLAERLAALRERLAECARAAGRAPEDVKLVAVSKTFGAERVREAAAAGQRAFGENRVQEAQEKIAALRDAGAAPLEWHLIGRLQRNKARRAVELFDVLHSVDRPELVEALARAAEALQRAPRILVQVDLDGEPQKGGVPPDRLAALVERVDACASLRLEGLMAIPRACADPEEVRPSFARLRGLLETLNRNREPERRLRELSMGMSADFEVAIQEGATCVRLGTVIFGEREKR